jgi:ComEC/Rec2-related protein
LRDPLLAPLAAIATGILLSRLVPFETRELGAVIAAYVILSLVCLWRRARVLVYASTLFALVAAGSLVAVAHRMPPAPQMDTKGALLILTGCVVEPSAISVDRDQFVMELEPGARVRVSLYIPEGKRPPVLRYGQRMEFDARVRPTHNFNNPGEFDYVHYLARQGIYWTASARATAPIKILPGRCGWRFMSAIYWLRTASLDRLERLYANQPYETGMMQAILIGETAKLDKVWTEEYRSTGTFHALVISGAHVAVLAAFLLFLLRVCFVPPMPANLLTVLASWLYALVTGWQAPVVRSAAGFTLFMIGRLFYRESRIMNVLAAVAIGFLVLDPEQIFDASFQLSFLAVGFIAAFAVPLVERTSGPLAKAPRSARGAVSRGDAATRRNLAALDACASEVLPVHRGICGAAGFLLLRAGPDLGRDSNWPGSAHGGLLPPRLVFRFVGQRDYRAATWFGSAGGIRGRVHRLERAGEDRWLAAGALAVRRGVARALGAGLAHSKPAGLARRRHRRRPDRGCIAGAIAGKTGVAHPACGGSDGPRGAIGAHDLAPVRATGPPGRTRDDGHRRRSGRQYFSRIAGGQADAG